MYEREHERFRTANAQVVGVSVDSRFANAAWAAQIGITFPLLSDFYPHGAVAERYGVLNPRGMPERAIFVVDKDGIVRYIDVHELKEAPDPAVLFEELAKLT
ncbi:MAG TPA: redoxin domain-containing protein [Dongiaceae bacterium]|nr:redoxin domain-containing protein [Dongiaceae bacterium]